MKKNTDPLAAETFYHIYNRGINGEDLFKHERNYPFFLQKYVEYISSVAATYAYCLLKNHFHILIRTRSESEIFKNLPHKVHLSAQTIISSQFSHLFNSYSQSINKSVKRTGGLFETPFRRIPIENDDYLTQVTCYIHLNPQKHLFTNDFTSYEHSSYGNYISERSTFLERETCISWFGTKDDFIKKHQNWSHASLEPKG